jgi:hypothetical protein
LPAPPGRQPSPRRLSSSPPAGRGPQSAVGCDAIDDAGYDGGDGEVPETDGYADQRRCFHGKRGCGVHIGAHLGGHWLTGKDGAGYGCQFGKVEFGYPRSRSVLRRNKWVRCRRLSLRLCSTRKALELRKILASRVPARASRLLQVLTMKILPVDGAKCMRLFAGPGLRKWFGRSWGLWLGCIWHCFRVTQLLRYSFFARVRRAAAL